MDNNQEEVVEENGVNDSEGKQSVGEDGKQLTEASLGVLEVVESDPLLALLTFYL